MINFSLVTYGRLSNEFFKWVTKEYSTLEITHAASESDLKQMLKNANAYAGFYALDGLDVSHLKWIHSFGAGVDSFLSNKSIADNHIPISRTGGQLGIKIGEYCLAHVLNHFKKIEEFKSLAKQGHWKQVPTRNLYDCNLLILGTGSIGSGVANCFKRLVKSITGMNRSGNENDYFDHIVRVDEINENYDITINTLPGTNRTKGILNESFFSHFKNSLFINVGRGSTVVTSDLIDALNQGSLSNAVLDVFENEPLDEKSELWGHPSVTITPHISGVTTINDLKSSFAKAYKHERWNPR